MQEAEARGRHLHEGTGLGTVRSRMELAWNIHTMASQDTPAVSPYTEPWDESGRTLEEVRERTFLENAFAT